MFESCIGTISVANIHAMSLFDSRATHFYLGRRFVDQHKFPTPLLSVKCNINTGSGVLEASVGYHDYPVIISGRELFADIIVIDMPNYDAVLGMD